MKQFATDGAPALHEVEIASLQATADEAAASKTAPVKKEKDDGKIDGAVQIAIGVKKEVDFPTWYTNVLIKADMLDYYNVSGCYILRPWSYSIWEIIQGMRLDCLLRPLVHVARRVVQQGDQGDGCAECVLPNVRVVEGP